MYSPIKEFGKISASLSRNPLGIIALFIVLVYGIAAFVLGVSSKHLESTERLPLIWFLVIFPVIVLVAFYWLVSRHHVKLYAPHDFPNEEGFFRALSPTEQKQKLENEIQSIDTKALEPTAGKEMTVEMEGGRAISSISLRHSYVLAEELAFREIESEFGVSVYRQVAIGRDFGVDGIFYHKNLPVAIEVKYVRQDKSDLSMTILREVERFRTVSQSTDKTISFLLALVCEGLTEKQRDIKYQRKKVSFNKSDLSVDIRIYDFNNLKEKYGVSEGSTQPTHAQGPS